MSEVKSLMFVFDRMPDQDGCAFIEVENSEGQSVCAGEWRIRDDGLVELVVPAPSLAAEEPVFYAQVSGVGKKEGWRGLIKAERDSTNGYTVPLYIRPDFDAQRLRADTAEAELKREKEFHAVTVSESERMLAAAEQHIAELEKDAARYQWLRDKSQNHHQFYLSTPLYFTGVKFSKENVDSTIDAALNPNPEAESHE